MTLNKNHRRMLYQYALSVQRDHPDWPTHTCLEESFIKCAGFSQYTVPLETMLPEYRNNKLLQIEDYLKMLK